MFQKKKLKEGEILGRRNNDEPSNECTSALKWEIDHLRF